MAMDSFKFPPELCAQPLALIGLTGLDTLNNAVHRAIWDAFSNSRRQYRSFVQFKLLDAAHEFPPMKPKRSSYDWFIPKGILKCNWMNKHLNEIPAVVIIFYELDWDDTFWKEKSMECASRVHSVRAALEGRNTRIGVLLIQQTAPLPTEEDKLAAERAEALCASCELNAKSLFFLPHGDHLQGYTHRLENAFYDLAQSYYHHEARNIKSHRDYLNKTTHQYLFVRHSFKMGFLNELKQDGNIALKHYSQSYANLLEVRMTDSNALEIKTVAGLINYKLCKLMFQLSLPLDAISQFRKHIELFKSYIGPKELAFEHYAWMSKQFSVFGDIFDEAIRQGLPALQTQHPGFYYQQAAQYAIDRKTACLELCKNITAYPEPDPLVGSVNLGYYGQRAWRPGKLSAEPSDATKEKAGIQALQYLEKYKVSHSVMIISLLGNAITQFKTYRCPRMRRHLVVQMAEEYYSSKDYSKALTLLTHMLWDYRSEKWWSLLTNLVLRALSCAYLSASIRDYIILALEALGSNSHLTEEQKYRIYNNFNKILKKTVPDPEPDILEEDCTSAKELWNTAVNAEPLSLAVDMSNIMPCVESKAWFTQPEYKADQQVEIEIFIRSTCPQELQFRKLVIHLNNPSYSSELTVCQGDSEKLRFHYNQVQHFVCHFLPNLQDVGKDIQIGSVVLHIGSENERNVILHFTGAGTETSPSDGINLELQHFRQLPKNTYNFDNVKPLGTTKIVPRDSKMNLEVKHNSPALLGEWYPIKLVLLNKEDCKVCGVTVNVSLQSTGEDPNIEQATQLSEDVNKEPLQLPLQLVVGDLDKDASELKCFYTRAHRVGNRKILIKVEYTVMSGLDSKAVETSCLKEELIFIAVVKPFDITAKFFSLKFDPLGKAFAKEPFIVMPHVKCASPWPLVIEDSSVELSAQVVSIDDVLSSQLRSLRLKVGETGTDAFCVNVCEPSDQPVALGVYTLKWRRESEEGNVTSSTVTMPTIRVESTPIYIEMVLPAHGWVRTPMAVSYNIHNLTANLLDLELNIDASDAFMFSGHKQMCILPESVHQLDYNLYPLLSGLVALPRLKLTVMNHTNMSTNPSQLAELVERSLPSHVYVMPQGKGDLVVVKDISLEVG